ncbi:MAG: type II secretion system protein [Proteobacteria bacterium]|nr:type II secretion system protein [Pseudomonadota bacterium]
MSACRGFTLIELLVAISLATIITLLGVSLMRTSINSSVSNEEALMRHQAIRDAQRLIEYAWSGRQSDGFAVGNGQFVFTSKQKATGSLPLRFVCQPGENDDYALWYYKVSPPTREDQANGPSEDLSGEMLLDRLSMCKFGFLQAPQDDKHSAQWKDDWPSGLGAPALIRLDLATLHGTLPPFIFSAGEP